MHTGKKVSQLCICRRRRKVSNARDGQTKRLLIWGMRGMAIFTLRQLKALVLELQEWIAELEGRNG